MGSLPVCETDALFLVPLLLSEWRGLRGLVPLLHLTRIGARLLAVHDQQAHDQGREAREGGVDRVLLQVVLQKLLVVQQQDLEKHRERFLVTRTR